MYEMSQEQDTQPWYRQFWPWLLISLPASAVFGGIATIIIATNSPNALVADNYYKEGLAINQKTQRLKTASDLGISALLRASGDRLQLELSTAADGLGDSLSIEFAHATRADLDRTVELRRVDATLYQADDPGLQAGNWYVRLRPEGLTWELRGQAFVDDGLQTHLSGIQTIK